MGFPISHSQNWGTAAAAASLEIFPNPAFPSFAAAVVLSQRPDDKVIPSIVVNNPENSHVSSALGGFSYDTSIALDRVGGTLPPLFVCLLGRREKLDTPRVRPFRSSPDVRRRRERCRGESEEGDTLT